MTLVSLSRLTISHSSHTGINYEGVSKSFRTGRPVRELQMIQLSATTCSCIAILWVSLVRFTTTTLCVASLLLLSRYSLCLFLASDVSFLLMDPFRHLVGLLGRGISPAPRPLPTKDNTTQRNTNTHIHAPSRIQTCDPNVRAAEDSTCLRPTCCFSTSVYSWYLFRYDSVRKLLDTLSVIWNYRVKDLSGL
jgi:hypothetical protein